MDNDRAIPSAAHCQRCRKDVTHRLAFVFKGRAAAAKETPAETVKCAFCALLHWPMLKRSALAGIVVGTILTLLNQGDRLLLGNWHETHYYQIPLTYCVPFLVATYGALVNSRR